MENVIKIISFIITNIFILILIKYQGKRFNTFFCVIKMFSLPILAFTTFLMLFGSFTDLFEYVFLFINKSQDSLYSFNMPKINEITMKLPGVLLLSCFYFCILSFSNSVNFKNSELSKSKKLVKLSKISDASLPVIFLFLIVMLTVFNIRVLTDEVLSIRIITETPVNNISMIFTATTVPILLISYISLVSVKDKIIDNKEIKGKKKQEFLLIAIPLSFINILSGYNFYFGNNILDIILLVIFYITNFYYIYYIYKTLDLLKTSKTFIVKE